MGMVTEPGTSGTTSQTFTAAPDPAPGQNDTGAQPGSNASTSSESVTDGPSGTSSVTPSSTSHPQPPPTGPLHERAAAAAEELTTIVGALTSEARASNVGDELPSATLVFEWEERLTSRGDALSYFDSAFNDPRFPELVYSYYQLDSGSQTVCIVLVGDADPSLLPLAPGVYNSNFSTYIALEGGCSQYGANPTAYPRA